MKRNLTGIILTCTLFLGLAACGRDPLVSAISSPSAETPAEIVSTGEPEQPAPSGQTSPEAPLAPPLKVEILHSMGNYHPGIYIFYPLIEGGEAPLLVNWGCTSPDSKCPEFREQPVRTGFTSISGEFLEGHYQIDLETQDNLGQKASASFNFEIVSGTQILIERQNLREDLEFDFNSRLPIPLTR